MILKEKDPIEPVIERLETLMTSPDLPANTLKDIRKEIKAMRIGSKGELDCAFFLNGHVKDNPNRVLIHDLRIEFDGETAQFDHILINRRLEFWILESKMYSTGIKINDLGEFEYWAGNRYQGIPSPLEQVSRQARILKQVLKTQEIHVQRLGMKMHPVINTAILVAPSSRVIRPDDKNFNTERVIKADSFFTNYQKISEKCSPGEIIGGIARMVDKEVIIEFGNQLVEMHSPLTTDYNAKFGIDSNCIPERSTRQDSMKENIPDCKTNTPDPLSTPSCPRCGLPMVLRVSKRGEKAGESFWGCSAYPKCRAMLPLKNETEPPETKLEPKFKSDTKTEDPLLCPKCGEKLVLRTAKRGENAGQKFYGCSTYPKCRGTVPLNG